MIEETYRLGKIILDVRDVERVDMHNNEDRIQEMDKVHEVRIRVGDDRASYIGYEYRDSRRDEEEYTILNKIAGSNHSSTPSVNINNCKKDSNIDYKYNRYLVGCLGKEYYTEDYLSEEESDMAKLVGDELDSNRDKIKSDIMDSVNKVSDDTEAKNLLVIVRLELEGEILEMRETDLFTNGLLASKRYDIAKSSTDGECYLCGDEKTVYGSATVFKFFTMDNKKYLPDLDKDNETSSYPICADCYDIVKAGKEWLDEMTHDSWVEDGYFCQFDYVVVPKIFDMDTIDRDKFDRYVLSEVNNSGANEFHENVKRFLSATDLDVSFDLWIFSDNSAGSGSYNIYKRFENIDITHISEVNDTIENVAKEFFDNKESYLDSTGVLKIKDEIDSYHDIANLNSMIYHLFCKEAIQDDVPLEIMEKVVKGERLDYDNLINKFNKVVQSKFRKGHVTEFYSVLSLIFLVSMRQCGMLSERNP